MWQISFPEQISPYPIPVDEDHTCLIKGDCPTDNCLNSPNILYNNCRQYNVGKHSAFFDQCLLTVKQTPLLEGYEVI